MLGVDTSCSYFRNYGMRDLTDILERYGFALAIIEIYRPEWEKCGKIDIQISIEEQAVCVNVSVVKEKPTLNSW